MLADEISDTAASVADGVKEEVKTLAKVLSDANPISTEDVAAKGGRYVRKPKGVGENLFVHRFWYERFWRVLLFTAFVLGAVTFLCIYLSNTGLKIPLFTVSSADRGTSTQAADFLSLHGITYKYARVPVTLIPVEMRPGLVAMCFAIVTSVVIFILSLDFWHGHISNSDYVFRDQYARDYPEAASDGWFQNSYSRAGGINMAVNAMAAFGIDPAAPWIDMGIIMGLYALFPVLTSCQTYEAFFLAMIIGFLDCYMYYGNLYKIAMEASPRGIFMGIFVHAGVRGAFISAIGFGAFRWFTDNSHYEVPRTNWAFYGTLVALLAHLIFIYLGALRRAFYHWRGAASFRHTPKFSKTPLLDQVPMDDRDEVFESNKGSEFYFDEMVEGFSWVFPGPKAATTALATFALAIEITCLCWMEDTLYIK